MGWEDKQLQYNLQKKEITFEKQHKEDNRRQAQIPGEHEHLSTICTHHLNQSQPQHKETSIAFPLAAACPATVPCHLLLSLSNNAKRIQGPLLGSSLPCSLCGVGLHFQTFLDVAEMVQFISIYMKKKKKQGRRKGIFLLAFYNQIMYEITVKRSLMFTWTRRQNNKSLFLPRYHTKDSHTTRLKELN